MNLDLQALGFTQEELQQRVVDQLCERLTKTVSVDDEGGEHWRDSDVARKLNEAVIKRVDAAIEQIAAKHVLPNVSTFLEGFCLQATNSWGEKTGQPITFIEYLVKRAEHYITEKVNYDGKAKDEDRYSSSSWHGTQTRIAFMINSHLQYSIETAMKKALAEANGHIVKGLEETVKIKLKEVSDALTVAVKTK